MALSQVRCLKRVASSHRLPIRQGSLAHAGLPAYLDSAAGVSRLYFDKTYTQLYSRTFCFPLPPTPGGPGSGFGPFFSQGDLCLFADFCPDPGGNSILIFILTLITARWRCLKCVVSSALSQGQGSLAHTGLSTYLDSAAGVSRLYHGLSEVGYLMCSRTKN